LEDEINSLTFLFDPAQTILTIYSGSTLLDRTNLKYTDSRTRSYDAGSFDFEITSVSPYDGFKIECHNTKKNTITIYFSNYGSAVMFDFSFPPILIYEFLTTELVESALILLRTTECMASADPTMVAPKTTSSSATTLPSQPKTFLGAMSPLESPFLTTGVFEGQTHLSCLRGLWSTILSLAGGRSPQLLGSAELRRGIFSSTLPPSLPPSFPSIPAVLIHFFFDLSPLYLFSPTLPPSPSRPLYPRCANTFLFL